MDPNVVLEIIKLSLEITLQIVKDMPADQKQKFWQQHAEWQAFWTRVLERLTTGVIVHATTSGGGSGTDVSRLVGVERVRATSGGGVG